MIKELGEPVLCPPLPSVHSAPHQLVLIHLAAVRGPRCSHGFTLNTFLFSVLVEIDCLVFFFVVLFSGSAPLTPPPAHTHTPVVFAEHCWAFDHAQSVLVSVFIARLPCPSPPLPPPPFPHSLLLARACLHQPLVSLTDVSVPQQQGRNLIWKTQNLRSNSLLSCVCFSNVFSSFIVSPSAHIYEATD